MKIVNLTPHALHIRRADGSDIVIEPSGIVPRLEVRRADCEPVVCEDRIEIPVSRATFGALTGMPPVTDNDIFVVSALCAQSAELAGRNDVFAPGEAIRDDSGKIIGSQGLSYITPISPVRI